MNRSHRSWLVPLSVVAVCALLRPAESQPRRQKFATQADLDRVEKKLDEQRILVTKLIALHQQYLTAMASLTGDSGATPVAITLPKEAAEKPVAKPAVMKSD